MGVGAGSVVVPSWRAGEEMGESGIRNLNACLFSIPCAVNLSKWKVMEHFISRVLMEARGLGLEEREQNVGVRGAGTEVN